ncbi:MAG: ABC transporter ATP-binding protein [Phycisphaerae bacterium]|nr:ABC transporter ATP-binding protein [Phycisphaerae bacterium]
MSSDENRGPRVELSIDARGVGKCYHVYRRPEDRLKQALFRWRRTFYDEFWALRDVSVEVKRGEAVGIIGRNGSGKSTLLQVIAGTLAPTEGEVRVNGRVAALLELGSGFNPEFSGRENVFLNGSVLGMSQEQVAERFEEIAAFADIGAFIEQPVKTYSTGMVVRLAFAVQSVLDPDVLIVDEALAVGDMAFQAKCFRRIEHLRERGVSILMATHDTGTVNAVCDRALLMRHGRVAAWGPAKEVTAEYYRSVHELCLRDASVSAVGEERSSEPGLPGSVEPRGGAGALLLGLEPPARAAGCTRMGDGRAEIVAFGMFDDAGRVTRSLAARGKARLVMRIRFAAHVKNPHAGMALRDRQGQVILGAHTLYERRPLGPCDAGDDVVVEFEIPMSVKPGRYLLAVGVADHDAFDAWTDLDSIFDAREVEVFGERSWGLANVSAGVNIQRLADGIPVDGSSGIAPGVTGAAHA